MDARLNVITLAVHDLERSMAFYRDGMGLPTKGIVATQFKGTETEPAGAVVFFELHAGLLLALYPRTELAKDAKVVDAAVSSVEFSLGYLVESRDEVDGLPRQAEAVGATITDKPHDRAWGTYSGYFKDPDGHLWEIIWNPSPSG